MRMRYARSVRRPSLLLAPALLALLALSACASSPDTRPLTAAEREALLREQMTADLRRDVGAPANTRSGCNQSTLGSRLNARRTDYQGADSFDSRGCLERPPVSGPASKGSAIPEAPSTK
jgi:hypothetical protein